MPEIKLKPCPFCGGKAIAVASVVRGNAADDFRFLIHCEKCGIKKYHDVGSHSTFERIEKVKQSVIEDWNRRTSNETD